MSEEQTEETGTPDTELDKSELVRDAVVFQLKLALDGLIDFIMIPVSFVAAIISLVKGDRTFYEAMLTGRSLDRRLNLYGAARRIRKGGQGEDQIDAFARRVESEIRKEFKEGSLQNAAKSTFDKISESLKTSADATGKGASNGKDI